ncbi:ribosome biogenesis regulatory protein homolog isoform X2 [Prorops nasuta]|uniref:ribosome biogenesis regulatory protein homolog isoform X2 n=1 Tax=Prorops nasuta TaxID=863751 RepID=UPI0034CF4A04
MENNGEMRDDAGPLSSTAFLGGNSVSTTYIDVQSDGLDKNASEKSKQRKSTEVHKDVELEFDVGTLLACDTNVLDKKSLSSKKEDYLLSLTRDNVQLLINKIWDLPTQHVDDVIVATLPKPTYVLPRARAVPKPKPLTKWQQFAKEKGIKTKKRDKSKLKWDDELRKWIPTYGYKRAKAEEQKEWLIEMNDQNKPMEDPFAAAKLAKEERKSKNELQRLRNIAKSKNIKLPKVGLPTTEHFATSKQLATAVTVARVSTASIGKFQSRLPKEKDASGIAKEVPGMKRKAKDIPATLKEEKRRNTGIAESVLKKRKILHTDFATPSLSNVSKTSSKGGRNKKAGKRAKGAKKPKAGKGKRDLHTKVGGRKRR